MLARSGQGGMTKLLASTRQSELVHGRESVFLLSVTTDKLHTDGDLTCFFSPQILIIIAMSVISDFLSYPLLFHLPPGYGLYTFV